MTHSEEIKNKTAKVSLSSSHNDRDGKGVELLRQKIALPIFDMDNVRLIRINEKITKDALEACFALHPFEIRISGFKVHEDRILITSRNWATFYLEDSRIIEFTHYGPPYNSFPFLSVPEWVEMAMPPNKLYEQNRKKDFLTVYKWSSVSNWIAFFKSKIADQANLQLQEAEILLQQIQAKGDLPHETILSNIETAKHKIIEGKKILNALI